MGNLWQPFHKVGGGLFGSTLDTGGTNTCLTTKGHPHLSPTAVTGKPRNPEIWVSTKLEGTEGLLDIRFEGAISVAEPAVVGRQERFKMVRQNSPKRAEKGLSQPITTARLRFRNKGERQSPSASAKWTGPPPDPFMLTAECGQSFT